MMMNGCRRAVRTISCAVMVAAFMATFHVTPAQAAQIGVLDETAMTYTITVAEGETITMSAEDAAAILALDAGYTFVKDGKGILSVGEQIADFTGVICVTNGYYEATSCLSLGVGGAASGTVIANGATLALDAAKDTLTFTNEYITLSGTGVANDGALRNLSADGSSTNQQANLLRKLGRLTLADDTTVCGYSLGWTHGDFYMDGHTLTVDMCVPTANFNMTFDAVVTAGDIDVRTGRLFFQDATYAGGAENTVTIGPGQYLAFRGTPNPVPWSLVLNGTSKYVTLYPSSPKYDAGYEYNVWAGPVTLNGHALVYYKNSGETAQSSVAFTGPVSGTGSFIVNTENHLHLSCPSNTFTGGVQVSGSEATAAVFVDADGAVPPDGGAIAISKGYVALGDGVTALPAINASLSANAQGMVSNAVPTLVVPETPSLTKSGVGRFVVNGGLAITNTLAVNEGVVTLVSEAAAESILEGVVRYSILFDAKGDVNTYLQEQIGVTLANKMEKTAEGLDQLRQCYDHVKANGTVTGRNKGVTEAFSDWTGTKGYLFAYLGYFRNNAPTNVTITFAMSIADVEALWIDGANVLAGVGSVSKKVDGNNYTYFARLGEVTLTPGIHKMEILAGHFGSSSAGPRPYAYNGSNDPSLSWESKLGFAMKYGAFDAMAPTNSADYVAVSNNVLMGGVSLGTILTQSAAPQAADIANYPDRYRATFANLSGTGAGTLDLGGGETRTIEGLEGTLTLTNGALTVTGDWDLSLSAVTAKPLTVAAGATLTFGEASRFEPDETFCHGGHAAKVIAQTTDGGGTIVGMPRCEVRSWSLRRTESDGVTCIVAEYTPGFRVILR